MATTRTRSVRAAREFGTVADAAVRRGVSEKSIRRWIAAGLLTGYRLGPRMVRIDLAELDHLLQPMGADHGA